MNLLERLLTFGSNPKCISKCEHQGTCFSVPSWNKKECPLHRLKGGFEGHSDSWAWDSSGNTLLWATQEFSIELPTNFIKVAQKLLPYPKAMMRNLTSEIPVLFDPNRAVWICLNGCWPLEAIRNASASVNTKAHVFLCRAATKKNVHSQILSNPLKVCSC